MSVTVPRLFPPSLNVTFPVGVLEPVTVAVNVTLWPTPEGFNEELSDVVVGARVTTCLRLAEVLPGRVKTTSFPEN